jgi:predicted ArsR family transcriptional regulator
MSDEIRHVNLDSRQIRVLAHPLRSRLLGQLRLNGAATATRLAEVLGTNTGATSYHLRQLAEVGLVAEDAGAGHGRERWWRAAHDVTSWERDNFAGDPDAQAASDWLTSNFAHQLAERIEDWNKGLADEPEAWRSAAVFSDYIMRLGPDQLTEMLGELDAVIERWRVEKPGPDSRQVLLYLYPVPMPRSEES